MKYLLPITTLVASALLATNVEARWQATPGHTWDYLLGAEESVIKASKQDVVTIDLEKAEKFVPYLHSRGQRAICYFSGGTTEHRAYDREAYQKSGLALGGNGDGWGNQWLDIRNKAKLQPLIRKRMQRARSYGCDAVEVDCLGIYHYRSDYTKEDSYVFAKWVAETAHQEGISIGLKNVAGISQRLEPYFDFAVVESCAESPNLCKLYTQFTDHNKAVFIVHYGNRGHKLSGSSLKNLIKEQGGHRFTCVISPHENLHNNSINYDCSTGSSASSSGNGQSITTQKQTTTVKKTTTVKLTTAAKTIATPVNSNTKTPAKQVIPSNPSNNGSVVSPSGKAVGPNAGTVVPGAPVTPNTKTAAPGAPVAPVAPVAPGAPGAPVAPGASVAPGAPVAPVAPGAQVVPVVPGTSNGPATKQPVLTGNNNNDAVVDKEVKDNSKDDEGSGVGTTVAIIAGGVATAAAAGFIFLKKNKKYNSDSLVY